MWLINLKLNKIILDTSVTVRIEVAEVKINSERSRFSDHYSSAIYNWFCSR
jgi:hypothetical protein